MPSPVLATVSLSRKPNFTTETRRHGENLKIGNSKTLPPMNADDTDRKEQPEAKAYCGASHHSIIRPSNPPLPPLSLCFKGFGFYLGLCPSIRDSFLPERQVYLVQPHRVGRSGEVRVRLIGDVQAVIRIGGVRHAQVHHPALAVHRYSRKDHAAAGLAFKLPY